MRFWLPAGMFLVGVGMVVGGDSSWARGMGGAGAVVGLMGMGLGGLRAPPAYSAWLRHRGRGEDVILDRLAWVLPGLDRITPVTLSSLILRVGAWEEAPLRLADGTGVAVEVHAFAHVPAEEETVRQAGRVFGAAAAAPESLARAAEPLLASVAYDCLTVRTWPELDAQRESLPLRLQEELGPLLGRMGLSLERVYLVHLQRVEGWPSAPTGGAP